MSYANIYNGAIEATVTVLGAGGAFLAAHINNTWIEQWDMWILAAFSLVEGIIIIITAYVVNIESCYAGYIAFGTIYYFIITVGRYLCKAIWCVDS